VTRERRRQAANTLARGVVLVASVAALIPLGLVLAYTVANGLPAVTNLDFFINTERPVGIPGGRC
jgi:phosphate transport system permease protein